MAVRVVVGVEAEQVAAQRATVRGTLVADLRGQFTGAVVTREVPDVREAREVAREPGGVETWLAYRIG
jgi:hypothetical protein